MVHTKNKLKPLKTDWSQKIPPPEQLNKLMRGNIKVPDKKLKEVY